MKKDLAIAPSCIKFTVITAVIKLKEITCVIVFLLCPSGDVTDVFVFIILTNLLSKVLMLVH